MRLHKSTMPIVIPALRDPEHWRLLGEGEGAWVFLLGGSVDSVAEGVARLQKRHWRVFVHVDMVKGIANDSEGLRFFHDYAAPDGIISTHSHTVSNAVKLGMLAIQRIFLIGAFCAVVDLRELAHANSRSG